MIMIIDELGARLQNLFGLELGFGPETSSDTHRVPWQEFSAHSHSQPRISVLQLNYPYSFDTATSAVAKPTMGLRVHCSSFWTVAGLCLK